MRTNAGAIPAQTVSLLFLCGFHFGFGFASRFPTGPFRIRCCFLRVRVALAMSAQCAPNRDTWPSNSIELSATPSRYLFVSTWMSKLVRLTTVLLFWGASMTNHLELVACHDYGSELLEQTGLSVLQVSINRVSVWWLIKPSIALQCNFSLQGNTCTGSFQKRNFLDTPFFRIRLYTFYL